MTFFIVAWEKRRSTRTTTVLACLSLTTTPWSVRFGIYDPLLLRLFRFGSPGARFRGGLGLGGFRLLLGLRRDVGLHDRLGAGTLLRGDRLHARDVAADDAHARGVLELTGGALEAQVELLLLELEHFVIELIERHRSYVGGFHGAHSAIRSMKRVLTGSLAAASVSASLATAIGTPSTSNRMRPGLTRATQNSGVPLPLPMRISIGFLDTGTSGYMRIHTRPDRFMKRVSARRAASIWRAVTRSGSSALRPNWPKASVAPLVAVPWIRPLNALRNLVRFGCSMI